MNTRRIKGNKKESLLIRWLQKMTHKGFGRPALKGIHIENGKAIATDGYRMVITPAPEPFKGLEPITLEGKVPAGKFEVDMEIILDTFPDFKSIVPEDSPESIVGVNPQLLADILKGMKGTAILGLHGKNKPIEISGRGNDGEKVYAVLMPMHLMDQKIERPKI